MKTQLIMLLSLSSFLAVSQNFTKLNDATINSHSSDWFSVAPVDIDNNYTLELVLANNGADAYFSHSDSLVFSFNNSDNFVAQTGSNSLSACWADIDNDCDLDVYWPTSATSGSSYLYENNGDGTFTAITSSLLCSDVNYASGASWGDYDNDGLVDLFVPRRVNNTTGLANALYRNLGNFSFIRMDSVGTDSVLGTSTSGSWVDYDNDGDLDLYVTNRNNVNNEFYINNGNGSFTLDTSLIITKDGSNSNGSSWGDFDNNGYQDLFVANVGGEKNQLYKNNGNGSFTEITSGAIVNDQLNNHGSTWGDFNNDGYLDLFLPSNSNIWSKRNILYLNNGNGSFSKVTSGSQYSEYLETFGATVADLNEDGFIDILTPNRFNGPLTIHLNNGNANGYIHLNLKGNTSNTAAIGTRVMTTSALGTQSRTITQQTGFNHHSDFRIKMGFGSDTLITKLKILWPSGDSCVFTNLSPNGFYNVEEGLCQLDTFTTATYSDSSHFLQAYFDSELKGAVTGYHWDFGDGDTSNLANPQHSYPAPGNYQVKLTVYDAYCKHRLIIDSINICPDTAKLGFYSSPQGLQLTFTDTSISAGHQFDWDFGDGSSGSGLSASHTYSTAGTYQVCLSVTDSCRSKQLCRSITVCNDTLMAAFGSSTSGYNVSFNDSSINASSISWDFGDGTSATGANPSHTYSAPGYYFVCQTVQDICTSSTFCDTIEVCLDTAQANFNYNNNGLLYNFSDLSNNANSWFWDFGDGDFSSQPNPAHIYQSFGTYTVCLTVTNDCYSDSSCQTVTVCNLQGQAAFSHQSTVSPMIIQFTDQSQDAVSYLWDFGDGSQSTKQNPLKAFSDPLLYNVCLTITDSCGSQDSSCQAIDLTPFSTAELDWLNEWEIYPNPTKGKLFLASSTADEGSLSIKLFDLQGKKILSRNYGQATDKFEISMASLPKGVYLLELSTGGVKKTLKINKL